MYHHTCNYLISGQLLLFLTSHLISPLFSYVLFPLTNNRLDKIISKHQGTLKTSSSMLTFSWHTHMIPYILTDHVCSVSTLSLPIRSSISWHFKMIFIHQYILFQWSINTNEGSRSPAPPPGPAPRPQTPVQPRPASVQQQSPNRQNQQKKKKVQKQQPKVNTVKKDPWPQVINTTLIKMVLVTGLLGDSLYRRHMNGFDKVQHIHLL